MAHFTLTPRPYPTYTPTPNREFTAELRAIWRQRYGADGRSARLYNHPIRVAIDAPLIEVRGGSDLEHSRVIGHVKRTLEVGWLTDLGLGLTEQPLTQEDADLVNRIRFEAAARAQALGNTPTYPGEFLTARQLFTPAQLRLLGLKGDEASDIFRDTLAQPAVVD